MDWWSRFTAWQQERTIRRLERTRQRLMRRQESLLDLLERNGQPVDLTAKDIAAMERAAAAGGPEQEAKMRQCRERLARIGRPPADGGVRQP